MAATIIIGLVIACYAIWVLYKKYNDWKAGRYCSCGSCSDKRNCQKKISR